MAIRATHFSLPIIAALLACGCGSEPTYNIPSDATKEAIRTAAETPVKKAPDGRKKVTKPPGGGPRRVLTNLKPVG